jgi:hypothetical protein
LKENALKFFVLIIWFILWFVTLVMKNFLGVHWFKLWAIFQVTLHLTYFFKKLLIGTKTKGTLVIFNRLGSNFVLDIWRQMISVHFCRTHQVR